jgi:hypothetical protein
MSSRPTYALIAIALSVAVWPAMMIVDYATRPCGDGLCGFFPGLIVLAGLVGGTLFATFKSARRNEEPALLRTVPLLIWALSSFRLFV